MNIQVVKIKDIKSNPNNPRVIKDGKFHKLCESIKAFPKMLELRPIVVNDDMIVLGGNMRLKASKEAGLSEVWIDIAEGLTEEQKKEFIVKDNVGFGEWEWDILANEWDSVQLAEWGLDVWENEDDVKEGLIEDDEIPEVKESIVKRGDIWQLGEHRVMCGDSTSSDDVEKLMNGEKADILITDPPYNVDYTGKTKDKLKIDNDKMSNNDFLDFLSGFFDCALIEMKEGSPIYVFCPIEDGSFLNSFLNSGFKLQSILVWVKNTIVLGRKDYQYKHEPILYGWKEGSAHKWYGEYDKSTIIECDKPPRNGEHPTMKPLELLEKLLLNSSKREDLVLDLFLGSGSTLIAAEKLNRKCYGMELDEKYCDVIINRWEQFTGLKAKKI